MTVYYIFTMNQMHRKFFCLVESLQKGKVTSNLVGSKVSKASDLIKTKDVESLVRGKTLPKQKLNEIIRLLKEINNDPFANTGNKDPFTNIDTSFVNGNTGTVPLEPMSLENQLDDPNQEEQNPVAKTFKQQGSFEEYVGKFSGLELKQKEIESLTNYTNAKPTKMDKFSIRFESTDEFSNNTITVIKKLREDTNLVFTVFQSTAQQNGESDTPEKQEIIVTKSISFTDEIQGGKILADLLQKLEI